MDYEKAKRALATLQEEKQTQHNRLQLAAEAKAKFDRRMNKL